MAAQVKERPVPEPCLPDEKFWVRYSPHHEFPLSGMTSLVLHALAIGVLVLASFRVALLQQSDVLKPPSMDVVQLEGGGSGLEGLGGELGTGSPEGKTEITAPAEKGPAGTEETKPLLTPNLSGPELSLAPLPTEGGELDPAEGLADILKEIQERDKQEPKAARKPDAPRTSAKVAGTPPKKGEGGSGLGGSGTGPGKGTKAGPGTGQGGIPGRAATQQEIFAHRWKFDLTGGPKEHAAKLDAMGIILALPDRRGTGLLVVRDLKRRPVELRPENAAQWKDAVVWYSRNPQSVWSLAQELRIPAPPSFILLLPKDREEIMAREERRYAESQGRDPRTIRETEFDFQLKNGAFEPVVIRQN